jgi:hypothetical protein
MKILQPTASEFFLTDGPAGNQFSLLVFERFAPARAVASNCVNGFCP